MLKIRLQRIGKKHDPSFRVVSVDSKFSAKSGKFLEVLGTYDARKGKPTFNVDRIKELMSRGAQISETVHNLLVSAKVIVEPKKKVTTITKKKAAKAADAKKAAEEAKAKADAEKAAAKEAEKAAKEAEKEAAKAAKEAEEAAAKAESEKVETAPEAPAEAKTVESTGSPQEEIVA